MLVYLDTNIVVYLIEQTPILGRRAMALMAELRERGDRFAVSHLVRMECKVAPLARSNSETLRAYEDFFASAEMAVLEVTGAAFDRAAQIRASHSLRTADALHLAAAIEGGCELFLTNDARLRAFPDISVISLL